MKRILQLTAVLMSGLLYGQQEFQFTQLSLQPYLVNPAAGGMMDVAEIVIGNRTQYVGVEGRPMTNFFSIQSRIRLKKRKAQVLGELGTAKQTFYSTPQRTIGYKLIGGLTFVNDAIGPFVKNGIKANFGVHLPISQKLNIGAGIGLGWSNFGINQSRVKLSSDNDQFYASYLGQSSQANYLDAQAGLVLYSDKLLVSISGTQLFNNTSRFNGVKTANHFAPHLAVLGAYRFDLGEKFGLEPLLQMKYIKHAPFTFDIAARVHYQQKGWIGISYRYQSAFGVGFGMNLLARFNVSYTFEFGTGVTQKFGANTHEVRLGILFGKKKKAEIIPVDDFLNEEETQTTPREE